MNVNYSAWLICSIAAFLGCTRALENGLARTPPMGFLTWLRYACTTDCELYPHECVSEDLIKRTADAMQQKGFLEAGYQYIIIDDCWPLRQRDPKTLALVPDPKRFPSGMKALGDYIRSKGFKLGIYLDYGTLTCGGYPGTLMFMERDLLTLRSWGTEYIKMDGCYAQQNQYEEGYEVFSKFINVTGTPMVFSCSYPAYYQWEKKPTVFDWKRLQRNCNLWRMYGDITSSWGAIKSIVGLYKDQGPQMKAFAAPGSWNDPDMIAIGNGGLSSEQEKLQFGMWAMFAAPLMLSTNISTLSNEQVALLQNKILLAMNREDTLGSQGIMAINSGSVTAWRRQLHMTEADYAIAFISEQDLGPDLYYSKTLRELGIPAQATASASYLLVDVFTNTKLGVFLLDDKISIHIPNTGIQMFTVLQK